MEQDIDFERYSRQIMLDDIGLAGQRRLAGSTVVVVGAGGLGTPILTHMAAMGVGRIRIVDRDIIEKSNLHRQTLYRESDVGRQKAEAAADILRAVAPNTTTVEHVCMSVNEGNAADVISGGDVVVDALDSVSARYALNRACNRARVPFVSGGAVGVSGQVLVVMPGKTACYECMFPNLTDDDVPSCGIEGVNPAVLSVVGGMQAAEAVRVMCGLDPATLGRVLHVNIASADFVSMRTGMVEACPVCGAGGGDSRKQTHAAEGPYVVEELCSRGGGLRTFAISPREPRVVTAGHDNLLTSGDDGSVIITSKSEDEAVKLYESVSVAADSVSASVTPAR